MFVETAFYVEILRGLTPQNSINKPLFYFRQKPHVEKHPPKMLLFSRSCLFLVFYREIIKIIKPTQCEKHT
jgi:hypothetical protein